MQQELGPDVIFQVPPLGTYFLQPGLRLQNTAPAGDPVIMLGAWGGHFMLKAGHQLSGVHHTVGRETSFLCFLRPLGPESFCQPHPLLRLLRTVLCLETFHSQTLPKLCLPYIITSRSWATALRDTSEVTNEPGGVWSER